MMAKIINYRKKTPLQKLKVELGWWWNHENPGFGTNADWIVRHRYFKIVAGKDLREFIDGVRELQKIRGHMIREKIRFKDMVNRCNLFEKYYL